MDKLKNFFTKYVFPASFIFTVFTLVILALSTGNTAENGEANAATLKILLIAFVYFLYVMLISGIYRANIQPFFRALIHYLLTGIPLVLFMIYISNKQASSDASFNPSTIVVLTVVYTVIYAIVAAIVLAIGKKKKTSGKKSESEYKSQFGRT